MNCECGTELDENDVLDMCKDCLSKFTSCMDIEIKKDDENDNIK